MDELLPILESEGLQLIIEPHPDDFIEDGLEALNLIRGLNADWIGFLYCTPHAFHQGHSPATIIEAGRRPGPLRPPGRRLEPPTLDRVALHLQPARQHRSGSISTWRWAGARWTSTRSSPRWPPSASTA